MSAPMSFWSENDVLEYLFKYELDYAECYGKIIPKLDKEQIEGQITIYEATTHKCKLWLWGLPFSA